MLGERQNNIEEKQNFIDKLPDTNIIEEEKESNIIKNVSKIKIIHMNKKKLELQKKIIIEDIEVYFPYNPYEKQITYMKSVIQTLNNKYYSSDEINYNALAALESPTGTGKTLCLLCALLAWVNTKGRDHKFSGTIFYSTRTHSQISQVISELNKTCYEPRIAILSSREHSCANTELKRSLAPSVLDIKCAREHKQCKFYKHIEYHSNINFGNIDIEDILKQGKAKRFCPFYVERTKVKMAKCDLVFVPYNYIFIKEIRESMDIELKNTILVIDEAHNVINNCEEARSLEINIKDLEEMVTDLKEVIKEVSKNKNYINSSSSDEEMIEENREHKEDNKKDNKEDDNKEDNKKDIKEDDNKEDNKKDIKEDDNKEDNKKDNKNENKENNKNENKEDNKKDNKEDDNKEENKEDNKEENKEDNKNENKEDNKNENKEDDNSDDNHKNEKYLICTLRIESLLEEMKLIKNMISDITQNKEKYDQKKIFKDKNYIEINPDDFLPIFMRTEEEIIEIKKKQNKNQKTLDTFFNKEKYDETSDDNKDYVNISQFLTEENIHKHIFFIKKIIKAIMNDYSRRTKLNLLLNLFEKINDILEDKNISNSYVYCLSEEKIQTKQYAQKKVIKLNIFCFNPGIGFNDIINFKPYSIIMTSGTLAPFDVLENELKIKFDTTLENEHIIDRSQYKFIIIKGYELYNKLLPFNFEYNNRSDTKTIAALGITILNLCKSVKNGGILVYFTSFSYLNKCYSVWGDNNIISQISQIKTIYFDDKKNKQLIKNFKNNKNKNSILLSVFRGTSSEGIDFSDEYARMVICVGVPYANIVEEKVQLKKKYLDEINEKNLIEGLTGKKWYLNDAISNVNQSLGRVLRHINDYGVLVCIDERFEYRNIKNLFSKWIRDKCEVVKYINDNFFDSLVQFFDEQEIKFKNIKEKEEKEKEKEKEKEEKKEKEKRENENIINKNEDIFKKYIDDNETISNSKNNFINDKIDNCFKKRKKVIEYGYEEFEESENGENNKITNKTEISNKGNKNKVNEEMKEINCELELDNLKSKYLENNNTKEIILLNKKTNPEHDIQNNEDINPNILISNKKNNNDFLIQKKDKDKHIKLKEERINIKNDIKNLANEIDNYKFDDLVSDFNNDKIKETQKQLDENENIKLIAKEENCGVCYQIFSNNTNLKFSQSKCNHVLCNICWSKTLYQKLECPICRKKARVKTLKRLIKSDINTEKDKTNIDEKIK